MSLLLQALQKAAKNRETVAPTSEPVETEPSRPEPAESALAADLSVEAAPVQKPSEPELALEDEELFGPDEIAPATATERFEPFAAPSPSSVQAATILRASETQTAGWVDWVRDHPVHTFAMVAGVFMVFYGTYVYLQLFHPALLRGDFLSSPLAAKTPPTQPVIPPPPAAPTVGATSPAAATPVQPSATVAAPAVQTATGPTAQRGGPMAPVAPAPPAAIAGMPQPPRAQPLRGAKAEQPVRPTPSAHRRARTSIEESLAAAPMVEDHVSSAPAESGRASLSPGITEAYQALQAGKLDQAESLYRGVVQADAQNVDALLGLATIAARRGNAQQAIGFYEQALRLEPRNAVAQAGMIDIIGQADPQMSETHLKQLIAREPSGFLYFSLGNLYARQAVWPAAQAAYFQAYNLQPDNPDYAYNLAIGLEHLEQPKLALAYYRKALELSFQKGHANFDQNRVIERIGQLAARVD
jgi:Tfp pilus assembly protein PilF